MLRNETLNIITCIGKILNLRYKMAAKLKTRVTKWRRYSKLCYQMRANSKIVLQNIVKIRNCVKNGGGTQGTTGLFLNAASIITGTSKQVDTLNQ